MNLGAEMRCPKCNKYMPDRCICNGPSIEEQRNQPRVSEQANVPIRPYVWKYRTQFTWEEVVQVARDFAATQQAAPEPTNAETLAALRNAERLLRAAGFAMTGTCSSKIIAAIAAASSQQALPEAPASEQQAGKEKSVEAAIQRAVAEIISGWDTSRTQLKARIAREVRSVLAFDRAINAEVATTASVCGWENPADETGGAVKRFGFDCTKTPPDIIPAGNGAYVWYGDYLKLFQSREAVAKASDARYREGYSAGWSEGRAALAQLDAAQPTGEKGGAA